MRRLWPEQSGELSDDDIVASLATDTPVLRVNFVSSVDGAVSHDGRSGGLSDDADKRHFELLRRVCDVVLVGAGTVRDEGYGAMRVNGESAQWRLANGLTEHPVFAIVSGSLDLDPASEIFTDAPVRPILFTSSRGARRATLFESAADVVVATRQATDGMDPGAPATDDPAIGDADAGDAAQTVHGPTIVAALRQRGLTSILCEGGPHLFGTLLADRAVDELFLTVSPSLEAGDAIRITAGDLVEPARMTLVGILSSGSTLLLRYRLA